MPRRPKVPPAEVSLAEVAASIAEMQRERKRDAERERKREARREAAERKREAERKAERAAERAERKAEREAERAERKAEREADRAERKREIAERKAEREAERAEREAERKRDAAERKAERKREAAAREADRAEREAAEAASKARYERMEEQSAKFREEWGVYTSNESEEVEDQIYNALDESKQIGDLRFDHVDQNLRGSVDRESCEFDIVAENGKVTVVLEVKHQLTLSDVRRFAKKHLPLFSKAFPGLAKNKDVIGAMAYQSVRDRKKTVQEALDFGLLLLRAEGKKGLRQIKTVADSARPSKRGK